MHLNPYKLKNLCDMNDLKAAQENHIMDCILCSSCSYICPARRPLAFINKLAKGLVREASQK